MKDNWKKVEKMSSSLADGMRGCLFVFVFQGGGGGWNENGWLRQKTLINSKIPTAAVRVKTSFGMLSSLNTQCV